MKLDIFVPIFAISTHTPHARRDLLSPHIIHYDIRFQLTRLMRGVTCSSKMRKGGLNISTHTPHARRDAYPK